MIHASVIKSKHFSALPVDPSQRPVTRRFDVFFDLRLNNGWAYNRDAVDMRRHRSHYDVTVMLSRWIWIKLLLSDHNKAQHSANHVHNSWDVPYIHSQRMRFAQFLPVESYVLHYTTISKALFWLKIFVIVFIFPRVRMIESHHWFSHLFGTKLLLEAMMA